MIKSAQGSPSPSFCGKARAPTNHGRRKNFRPRIFAQLSRDLPIFSNFDSNFRRKQNPFHPSFYCIAALPRVPTARPRAHRSARATTCTTSQTIIDPTVNSIAPHPHNRTSNSPATVRIAASTSDICFAPRSAHSHYLTPVLFRAQHSAVTEQTPHHSALNPTPYPHKPSPFNAISYASPFRTETLPHSPRPIRHNSVGVVRVCFPHRRQHYFGFHSAPCRPAISTAERKTHDKCTCNKWRRGNAKTRFVYYCRLASNR